MNLHQQRAWDMLTSQEKNSLYLQLSQGLSTWEAGEILGVTHYKYIELKDRSQYFMNIFSDFFSKHNSIFRPDVPVDPRFRDYIEACLEKRLKRDEALRNSGDSTMMLSTISSKRIVRDMETLGNSKDQHDIDTHKLIHEFDRWNNFRILPRKIQQPSAYKRRNNKRDKIYINYILNLPKRNIKILIDKYWYNPKRKKLKHYIVLVNEDLFEEGYGIIPVKAKPKQIKELSSYYIYIFEEEIYADLFGFQITRYKKNINNPRRGFEFWREYRDNLQRAVNYKEINNIDFYSDKLDMAYDIIPRRRKSSETKSKTGKAQRASEKLFNE